MKLVRSGVTRTVILTEQYAIKVAGGLSRSVVRGWLANRSEWKRRHRSDVCPAMYTLGYFVNVYARLEEVSEDEFFAFVRRIGYPEFARFYRGDELKASSWGRYGHGCRFVLIDYDAAWEPPRGWVGALYYANQERLARKWARL